MVGATISHLEKLENIVRPVVESFGCALWGIDFRPFSNSALLRVYIDKAEGITLDDCSQISYQLSGIFEVEDPIDVPYTLEVSSPGIDRPLLTLAHFNQYLGQRAKVRLRWAIEDQRNFVGIIDSVNDSGVILQISENKIVIPIDAISRGKLLVDLGESGSKGVKR